MAITLLHVFSTFAVGGPQTRFATIADRLGDKYRHLIVSMSGQTEAASLLSHRVNFELIPRTNPPRRTFGNAMYFKKELRRIKPDVLITYNFGAMEWALGNRFGPNYPHIHIEDGFGPDEAIRRLKRRIVLRRVALRRTKTLVVPSRTLEMIALKEWKIPKSKLHYLANGVDMSRFNEEAGPETWPYKKAPGELLVGTCSALRPEKNLGQLIRSFAATGVRNARLIICGEGPEHPALAAAARNAGIPERVTFTGYLTNPEFALRGFDIFAMSSDTEQMPYSLLEAMATGLPAAATGVGDIPTMVADENKPFIVGRNDEFGLAGALRTLLGDAALRAKVGAANEAKARAEYSLETMVAAYDRLFEKTAAKK